MTRNPLTWAASALMLTLAAAVWMVATEAASTLHAIPARLAALQASLDALPAQVLPPVLAEVHTQGTQIAQSADAQITALRSGVLARVDGIELDAKGQVAGAVQLLDTRSGEALAIVRDLQAHATPLLAN